MPAVRFGILSKKALCTILCALLIFFSWPCTVSAYSVLPSLSAQSAILIDASSDLVLFEKNARIRMPMASTTKIMTAIVALESCDPLSPVTVDSRAVGIEGSSVYLKVGERLSLLDLLYCLMLASANDAAAAIAYFVAGGIDEFAARMNEKATELGLFDTHFENPHGLDSKDHYTTAYDLARLTAYALENESIAKIVSTNSHNVKSDVAQHSLFNHNRLLRSYAGAIGVKTGFTKTSGRCLVSAAEREGMRLVCVTLKAPDDWNDHKELLDYGFEHFCALSLCKVGQSFYEIPVVSGEVGRVLCIATESLSLTATKNGTEIITVIECQRFLWKRPISGERIGKAVFYHDGQVIAEVTLAAHIIY